MRARRERSSLPRVALAGYTNAGKSTLLNALTGAEVGRGGQALPHPRPDHAQLRALRPRLPADRHRRLHREAAPPAGRGLQGDPGGDRPRRPDPARRRRRGAARSGGSPTCGPSTRCWRRSAPGTSRACWSSTRPTCSTRRSGSEVGAAPSRRGAGLGARRRGARGAARADRGGLRGHAGRGRAADPLRRGRRACTSCTRSPATWSGPIARTACSSTRGSRSPSCTASTISPSPSP